jgi:Ca-activated chloride channel homolog
MPHTFRSWLSCLLVVAGVAACSEPKDAGSGGGGGQTYGANLIGYKNALRGAAASPEDLDKFGGVSASAPEGEWSGSSAGTGGVAYDSTVGGYAGTSAASGYEPGSASEEDAGVEVAADGGSTLSAHDAAVALVPHDAGLASDPDDDAGSSTGGDAGRPTVTPMGEPENPYHRTSDERAATFSIDVDTGSYTLTRGYVEHGELPPAKSVRIEELINYFHFHYAQPQGDTPLAVYTEMAPCPWNPERQLLLLGVQGQEVALVDQPAANLVFLIDVSGSMQDPNKLPLLKKGFRMLVRQLRDIDRVAIVTYAGADRVALPSTPGSEKDKILAALDSLEASGSTNGEGGIQKAYQIATENFVKDGNNRIILATDGDFNVGAGDVPSLVDLISAKRETGVFLSVYGFGAAWEGGNYQDETLEQLADNGNGIYFFIDGAEEARRAFLQTVSGSLLTVAKDVKLQVEFNTDEVKAYRLIGYENRVLANSDFGNDSVDAGELGAGLSVTALFEVIPADSDEEVPLPLPGTVPELHAATADAGVTSDVFAPVSGDDLFAVRIRYKDRAATESKLITENYGPAVQRAEPTPKFAFAAAVAELGMQLRGSQYVVPRASRVLLEQVDRAKALDGEGAVAEFHALIEKIEALR